MKPKEPGESQKAMRAFSIAMLAGLLSVPIYALHTGGMQDFMTAVSVGLLLAGAAAVSGGVLGFLFGIPRTLQQDGPGPGGEGTAGLADGGAATPRINYRANTNLEQISDWLTKILVGVGLTQIGEIRSGLSSLTAFAAQGLGAQAHSQVFAFALLSYSTVLGFLFGYLWTRLFLAGALRVADQAAIGNLVEKVREVSDKVETTERKLNELKKQSELDADALNLAYRHLNPSQDLPPVSQSDLDAAVAAASRPVKVQIFNQAWQVRSENWREAASKPKMERSIAVFRALIRSDVKNEFHMNHGQLGFALKDQTQPDWVEAEKELSVAIELRGPWNERGWVFYEFNRAFCRIVTDPAFKQDQASDPERKARILEDLRIAIHADDIKRIYKTDPVIQKWMVLNNVAQKDLRNE
jgi:hypothetical protein